MVMLGKKGRLERKKQTGKEANYGLMCQDLGWISFRAIVLINTQKKKKRVQYYYHYFTANSQLSFRDMEQVTDPRSHLETCQSPDLNQGL